MLVAKSGDLGEIPGIIPRGGRRAVIPADCSLFCLTCHSVPGRMPMLPCRRRRYRLHCRTPVL